MWNTSGTPFIIFEFMGGMLYFVLPSLITSLFARLNYQHTCSYIIHSWFPSPATNRRQNSDECNYIVLNLNCVKQLWQLFGGFCCTTTNTKATPGKRNTSVLCVKLNTNMRIPKKNQHRRFHIRDTLERIELSCTMGDPFLCITLIWFIRTYEIPVIKMQHKLKNIKKYYQDSFHQ